MDKQIYNRYRSELEHEDNLINHRLSWFLAAQSLLLAALGVSLQKDIEAFTWMVILAGFCSSVLILASIWAAISTFRYWLSHLQGMKREETSDEEYPQLSRPPGTVVLGFVAPAGVPFVFSIVWLFLACVYVFC